MVGMGSKVQDSVQASVEADEKREAHVLAILEAYAANRIKPRKPFLSDNG
jgi:hypothetical protein